MQGSHDNILNQVHRAPDCARVRHWFSGLTFSPRGCFLIEIGSLKLLVATAGNKTGELLGFSSCGWLGRELLAKKLHGRKGKHPLAGHKIIVMIQTDFLKRCWEIDNAILSNATYF